MKGTIIWILCSAFIIILNIRDAEKKKRFFQKLLFDHLTLVAVIKFVMDSYPFSFPAEIILVPVITLIAACSAYVGIKQEGEYDPVKKIFTLALIVFGFVLITHSLLGIERDYENFFNIKILKEFLLEPALVAASLPFFYMLAVFLSYKMLFLRINIILRGDDELIMLQKRTTLLQCGLSLTRINMFNIVTSPPSKEKV